LLVELLGAFSFICEGGVRLQVNVASKALAPDVSFITAGSDTVAFQRSSSCAFHREACCGFEAHAVTSKVAVGWAWVHVARRLCAAGQRVRAGSSSAAAAACNSPA
jgi:hypothetical protein